MGVSRIEELQERILKNELTKIEQKNFLTVVRDALAEDYCNKPRCAQMTRSDKEWHRCKAAFQEGFAAGLRAHTIIKELTK